MNDRIAILGANGQLGTDLCAAFEREGRETVRLTHADADVRDAGALGRIIDGVRPRTLINTTAFHKVEACEEDPETAFAVNCHAVRALARLCAERDVRLVHFSTDYVFGGDVRTAPYDEQAPVAPLNAYGVSKAAGELFVRNAGGEHLLVRVSGLFGVAGASGKGGNFIETMLRLGRERGEVTVVTDQVLSPTSTQHLAEAIVRLEDARASGLFHVTGSGSCSWFDFARAIFDVYGERVAVRPATTEAMGGTVRRPAYSVLENRRMATEGFGLLPHWREGLEAYREAKTSAARTPVALTA